MVELSSLVCTRDFEIEVNKLLPRDARGFYSSGALQENTLRENEKAFQGWYIRPRFLVDVSKCDLSTKVLGYEVKVPFGVAPVAMQKLAHPEGECASARATLKIGTVFGLSTTATTDLETVANESDSLKFFQLYVFKDKNLTKQLIQQAEKFKYRALVITVDVPVSGIRYSEHRNNFKLPSHCRLANFDTINTSEEDIKAKGGFMRYLTTQFDASLTWEDIKQLKRLTSLPIVLKGILTAEDAIKGVEAGASAIWVSNHGGRQIDGVLPTIEVLPEVVAAVGHKCEVYVDGGVRTGSDIFKALALGANMVFIGRPIVWGLACGGFEGALRILSLLQEELKNTMCLSGCPTVKSISREFITRGSYSKL